MYKYMWDITRTNDGKRIQRPNFKIILWRKNLTNILSQNNVKDNINNMI